VLHAARNLSQDVCQPGLIQELEEKDKNTIFNIIETMLTKKKFKDFFQKNVAAL
jgi:hypothetical protein